MPDHSITAPAHPFRGLVGLAGIGTLGTLLRAATSLFHRGKREPPLPRMSDEWLRNLEYDSGRRLGYWRDSW